MREAVMTAFANAGAGNKALGVSVGETVGIDVLEAAKCWSEWQDLTCDPLVPNEVRSRYLAAIPSGTLAASLASGAAARAGGPAASGAGGRGECDNVLDRKRGTESRTNCISICGRAPRSISKCLVNKHTCCGLGGTPSARSH